MIIETLKHIWLVPRPRGGGIIRIKIFKGEVLTTEILKTPSGIFNNRFCKPMMKWYQFIYSIKIVSK